MEYCSGIIIVSSDLYHHGILGQKWGKRNGPPYPLFGSAHSSSEKDAGWKKSLKGGGSGRGFLKKKKAKVQEADIKKEPNKLLYTEEEQKKKLTPSEKIATSQKQLRDLRETNPDLYESYKQAAIKKGKASDVLGFKGDLTNQQLNDAINRINYETQLSSLSQKEYKTNWDKIDDVMKRVNQVAGWMQTTNKAYAQLNALMKQANSNK